MFVVSKISAQPITLLILLTGVAAAQPASSDNVFPTLKSTETTYTLEKPNSQYYGDGVASRATEASALRLEAERDMQGGKIHDALRKARKAAQFDPDSTDSHLILARVLTKCVKADGYKDKGLYAQCVREWRTLRWHDSSSSNQDEAASQLTKLRVARVLSKIKAPPVESASM